MKETILVIMILVVGVLMLQPIFADSELPPVYQESQLILDKSWYTLGDTITVTVISPLNNTDPNVLDIMMTADALGLESKHVTHLGSRSLLESGPDTGIFVGKFQIIKSGDKPSENPESIDGYLEVSPDTDSISVMLKDILGGDVSGRSVGIIHTLDQTSSNGFTNRTISVYPNAHFMWKESISPNEGIGIMRVEYPSQNISDEIDSLVVRFIQYDYDARTYGGRLHAILTETGKDTGVFEAEIPVTTQYSPAKLNLKSNTLQHIDFEYYIDDRIEIEINSGLTLFNSLANSDSKPNNTANPITIQTDNDWYLSDQQITINGMAEPNEDLNIAVFSKEENGQEKFRNVKANSTGSFSAYINWNEQRFASGSHTIEIVGSKHDEISAKDVMIVSLDQLHSRSIDVSPKRQLQMGIMPEDIVCHQVWKLVLKPDGKTPTCLEPPTASKLEKRGWVILQKDDT